MTIEMIYAAILSAAPAIASIVGCITALIKMKSSQDKSFGELVESFEKLENQVKESNQYTELKRQLVTAHQENRELKKKLNELLTKMDHIRREDDA